MNKEADRFRQFKDRVRSFADELMSATRAYESEDENEVRESIAELENKAGGAILRFMRGES